jgi:hypothetical protein
MRLRVAALALLVAGCAHQSAPPSGHGAIALTVAPNPIVAQQVTGNTFDFPFDIVVRETGGHPLTIGSMSLTVYAFGLAVNHDSYNSAQIAALGFPTQLAANGELRYHLKPRRAVTDERLFTSITASVRIDATDDSGTPASSSTTVSVTR